MKKQQCFLPLYCIFIVFLIFSCNKTSKNAESQYELPNFEITEIEERKDFTVLSYKYSPDVDSIGYSNYGVYEGKLYVVKEDNILTPILNVIKNREKSFGEKLHLEEMVEDENSICLKYYIEPYGNLASCFGYIEVTFIYSSGTFTINNYSCDIESRFSLDEDTGDEYPDKNGEIIYKIDFTQEDFMKIVNEY